MKYMYVIILYAQWLKIRAKREYYWTTGKEILKY